MPTYLVSFEAFRRWYAADPPARLIACMQELVERYSLKGRSILSLAGGTAEEECALSALGGNRLAVVDIDQNELIEPSLKQMPAGALSYTIDDAENVTPAAFDVLYASSFTPDELRRTQIINQRATDDVREMTARFGGWEWPPWRDPLHPTLARYITLLPAGGLFIGQSYSGGLDAIANRHYLPACDRQLDWLGLDLLEVWRFRKTTGVMLYVAQKRGGERPPLTAPMTQFHWRAETPEAIEQIWPPRETRAAAERADRVTPADKN